MNSTEIIECHMKSNNCKHGLLICYQVMWENITMAWQNLLIYGNSFKLLYASYNQKQALCIVLKESVFVFSGVIC